MGLPHARRAAGPAARRRLLLICAALALLASSVRHAPAQADAPAVLLKDAVPGSAPKDIPDAQARQLLPLVRR